MSDQDKEDLEEEQALNETLEHTVMVLGDLIRQMRYACWMAYADLRAHGMPEGVPTEKLLKDALDASAKLGFRTTGIDDAAALTAAKEDA